MVRRIILCSLVTFISTVLVALSIILPKGGVPFSLTQVGWSDMQIQHLGKIALPDSLSDGDIVRFEDTDLSTKIAIFMVNNLAPQTTYTLVIQHHKDTRFSNLVPVEATASFQSVELPRPTGKARTKKLLLDAVLIMLLCLAILTLWLGRNWTAWGLSLYAVGMIMTSTIGYLPLPALAAFALKLCGSVIFYPLALVGLYITSESLSGDGLTRYQRYTLRSALGGALFLLVPSEFYGDTAPLFATTLTWWNVPRVSDYFSFVACIPGLCALLFGYAHSPMKKKIRIRWILISEFVLLGPFVLGYFFGTGLTEQVIKDVFFAAGYAGLLFGVLRHRLIDISFLLNRAIVYAGTTTLILLALDVGNTLLQSALSGKNPGLFLGAAVPLFLGAAFKSMRSHVEDAVVPLIFRKQYWRSRALRNFADSCRFIESRRELLDQTLKNIAGYLAIKEVSIYVRTENRFCEIANGGTGSFVPQIGADDPAFVTLRATNRAVILDTVPSILGNHGCMFPMDQYGYSMFVLVVGMRPVEAFSADDMENLTYAALAVGAALRIRTFFENEDLVRELATGTLDMKSARRLARELMRSQPWDRLIAAPVADRR